MERAASVCAIAVACVALMGCQPGMNRQEAQVASRPNAKAAYRFPVWPFFFPAAQAYRCDKTNANPCDATVASTRCLLIFGCSGTLDHDPLVLVRSKNEIDITWTLPAGFGFCTKLGDGVFLKSIDDYDQNQFRDLGPIGKPSGPSNKCKQQYQWLGHNLLEGQQYEYRMVFRDSSNNIYVLDPWIDNE
jgi:hypothetical protein